MNFSLIENYFFLFLHLRVACVRFRALVRKICPQIEPFECASTIAKLALNIWRHQFLPPNSIVNFPEEGINTRTQQSQEALRFFKVLEKITGWSIRTASWSIGEWADPEYGFRIDGVVTDGCARKTCIEFNGCYFHGVFYFHKLCIFLNYKIDSQNINLKTYFLKGCPSCYKDRGTKLAGNRTAEELLEATAQRKAKLERKGNNVYEVWECHWKKVLAKNPRLQRHYDHIFVPPPMHPRKNGLRGGRVEPFRLLCRCSPEETIELLDIVNMFLR